MKRYFNIFFFSLLSLSLLAVPPVETDYTIPHRPRYPRVESINSGVRCAPSSMQASGRWMLPPKGVLIMAEFQDVAFAEETTVEAVDSMANGSEYTYDGATGSVAEYYRHQSNGQYDVHFDVVGPVKLPHEVAYYGRNDASGLDGNTGDFVAEAVEAAYKLGIDFSSYDYDKDGYIDFVYILYAGKGEHDSRTPYLIWPHGWDLKANYYYGCTQQSTYYYNSPKDFNLPKYDGLWLNDYVCSNELGKNGIRASIGTFAHEFGHQLGLPDYYASSNIPTIDKEVEPYTPGSWSIMGYGCYNNGGKTPSNYSAYDKYFFGWVSPVLPKHNETYTMPADNSTCFMITRNGNEPALKAFDTDTIYYLENRQYQDWDWYLPGHGMLVWQVTYNRDDWYNNVPNNIDRIGYTLLTADGSTPYNTNTMGRMYEGQPFPGTSNVQEITLFGRYQIKDIQETEGVVSFTFVDMSAQPTGCNNGLQDCRPVKTLDNGSVVIQFGDEIYDIVGRRIR